MMCKCCLGITEWYNNLDTLNPTPYSHHASFEDLNKSAQAGCSLCDVLRYDIGLFPVRKPEHWGLLNPENDTWEVDAFLTRWRGHTTIKLSCLPGSLDLFILICYEVGDTTITGTLRGDYRGRSPSAVVTKLTIVEPATHEWHSSLDSESAVETAKEWINACLKSHPECVHGALVPFKPTRLIDVSASPPRLTTKDERVTEERYCALSYCWGSSMPVTSKTTSRTLATHEQGIALDLMPKTLRDAVQITRSLGLRYIWIDALCILQDSPDDWRREAEIMGDVYAHAHLTLAAASSNDCNGGMFHTIDPRRYLGVELGKGQALRAPPLCHEEVLLSCALSQRAWAFQERELSPRLLWYSSEGLMFECRRGWVTQEFPEGDQYTVNPTFAARLFDVGTESAESSGVLQDQAKLWFSKWRHAIHQYSSRLLTRELDRLPAILGLAKRIQGLTGSNYSVGVMHDDALRELLWFKISNPFGRGAHYRKGSKVKVNEWTEADLRDQMVTKIPSWSWVSAACPITFLSTREWEFQPGERNANAKICAKMSEGRQHHIIRLTAWVGSLEDWLASPEYTEKERWATSQEHFDEPANSQNLRDVQVLTVMRFHSRGWIRYAGLLIVPVGKDGQHRRVGMIIDVDESWIFQGEVRSLTLT